MLVVTVCMPHVFQEWGTLGDWGSILWSGSNGSALRVRVVRNRVLSLCALTEGAAWTPCSISPDPRWSLCMLDRCSILLHLFR